ncbi:helicase-related protein [Phaeovulum vinaykumarii]|uniref:ATP-dependent RNA helicase SUPV3L1/SUV3 n=1 Tax=Phaeovulum vinaykumarii TaxID=407234 RepID=A0A1N7MGU9_9RHOB|nr:helicase-related protein [Phaeovulum vinaykumarii]SIS85374.1 ATP-dependent RNA helicase SUPV3L1/SUV3 [Phaeovulum vinaykumarii]SOC12219.1 ATP-dependent RNA helicase SUPV3L1/SUV3 [Phaeovulum vinaykumarii]
MAGGRIAAVLGPTNTGKTHHAIERMLAHRTGVIGLPLRLLAREVYDRIVAQRGPSVVALVTGEERIVPERAAYWVCTTEAMPTDIGADFLAVDEIQLCGDPERGHVFTDRLLHARGTLETLFLGSSAARGAIAELVPGVQFSSRERLSTLSWAGSKKTSRMPPRAAIVGFSVDSVYAMAELLRRQKGGCAVVMGALSPRTRNAQVALYQNGDVDYLVATDAIGMGLNLDIDHVAFSALAKFDGRRMRALFPHEIGQIAGRAGRFTQDGTFGVTGEASAPPPEVIEAVEGHRFAPIERLQWRNARLEFGTPERLIASLEAAPDHPRLQRGREADDLRALKALVAMPEIRDRLRHPSDLRRLWDVSRIPDFRSISETEHSTLLARIFGFLQDHGHVPEDWLAGQIARIDRTHGDIDALSRRLAFIRTWTYVAQRHGWLNDESHWREKTRAVEDRLSDALHGALTQRFVDRRTSVLLRRLKQKESLVAEVNDKGEVSVEGEFAGRLAGFRFIQDGTSSPDEAKTLARAAYEALRPEFSLRADRFYNAPDTELDVTEQGGLMWGEHAVGKLVCGAEALKPQVEAFVDEEAGDDVAEKVRRRLQHFIDRKISTLFEPLLAMSRDEALTGLARGFAFRIVENLGILPRDEVANEVRELDQDMRAALRRHGVRFGQYTIFLPALLKPAPTRLRLVLWGLHQGLDTFPEAPPPGLVTIPNLPEVERICYTYSGYRPAGARAIRIDMLERLADMLRPQDSRGGFEATPDMLSITGMTLEQFADLMGGLGYKGERGERPRTTRPATPETAPAEAAPETGTETGAEAAAETAAPETATAETAPAETPTETPAAEAADSAPAETAAAADAAPAAAEAPEGGAATPAAAEEIEVFYTFTWAPKPRGDRARHGRRGGSGAEGQARGGKGRGAEAGAEGKGDRPRRSGGPRQSEGGDRPERSGGPAPKKSRKGGKSDKSRDEKRARSFEAHPPRDKKVDPDNPFAVLAQLRDKI